MSFIEHSYSRQAAHYKLIEREIEDRFHFNSIDRWRHGQMYDKVKPLINSEDRWLTIGDGRYGSDAYFLKQRGIRQILATDLSDTLLRAGKEAGIISEYRIENAEALSFSDNSFDWVFCKEAYHHFPRPTVALYEMLRVARKGIVLIEPHDQMLSDQYSASVIEGWSFFKRTVVNALKKRLGKQVYRPEARYEESGNYVYTISKRDIEKVALGIDLPWISFCGLCDFYQAGYENELAEESNPLFRALKKRIQQSEEAAKSGAGKYNLLVSVIGKNQLGGSLKDGLQAEGYEVIELARNPYIPE